MAELREVLRTNRAANLIEVKDQEELLKELSQLEQALRAGAPLIPHKYIEKGQRCRVMSGPLADLTGVVVMSPKPKKQMLQTNGKTQNVTKLVLQIDMLGQAACVELDTDIIEVLD